MALFNLQIISKDKWNLILGNAKVFLLSFFKLVPDVRPAFILVDDSGNASTEEIEKLRKKVTWIISTGKQKYHSITWTFCDFR